MEQLTRSVKGLAMGEFELIEYTRGNTEDEAKNELIMSFGFKVKTPLDREETDDK